MKWWPGACRPGDMVRVRVGGIWHYGVYVSDAEVIQFGLPPRQSAAESPDKVRVCQTTMDEFSGGSIIEVAQWTRAEARRRLPPEETVRRARLRLGEGGYNLLHNNCEHFAYECVLGEKRSEQEEGARKRWRERPLAAVYLIAVPDALPDAPVQPPARHEQIQRTKGDLLRRQRWAAWQALACAAKSQFRVELSDAGLKKRLTGQWVSDRFCLSLTHAGKWAAAAVSTKPVGVDLELPGSEKERPWAQIAQAMASMEETRAFDLTQKDHILALWTRKESAFKRAGGRKFSPDKVNGLSADIRTFELDNGCVLSLCGEFAGAARLYLVRGDQTEALFPREWGTV